MTLSHIESHKKKREQVKQRIHEEHRHASADDLHIRDLKKKNLHLKEEIVRARQ
jgi:hypothetical protein